MPRVRVKSYRRRVGPKVVPVKHYSRHHRKKAKGPAKYKKVGVFYLGHDAYGNIAGSKIKPIKAEKEAELRPKKENIEKIAQLDRDYITGKIKFKDWIKLREKYA